MNIEVASSDDIAALYVTYIELVNAGQEAVLDIAFAPGVYGIASIGPIQLDLGGNPAPAQPRIDVVLRGAAEDQPTVFRDMAMLVNARSLQLENLILTGRQQTLLEARVAREFAMSRCVVASNDWGGPWSGVLMRVSGTYGHPAYSVDIADTWFVRNGEQSEAALLAVTPATGSFIDEVKLRRVTFLDNTTHCDLMVREARTVYADDVIAVKCHAAGAVILRCERTGQVAVVRSTFVVNDPATIGFEDPQARSSGLELTRSRIFITGDSRVLPRFVRGYPEIRDGSRLRLHRSSLDDLAAAITSAVLDPSAARARLRDALGL